MELLSLFFLFSLFTFSESYSSEYAACSRPLLLNCGGRTFDVKFPFSAPDRPEFCGFSSSYRIKCKDGEDSAVIHIGGSEFLLKSIDYTDGVMKLGHLEGKCPVEITETLIEFISEQQIITVVTNCLAKSPYLFEIPFCDGSYSVPENFPPEIINKDLKCGVVKRVPSAVLYGEFDARWRAGESWCGDCTRSGGVCGFNSSSPEDHLCFFSASSSHTGICQTVPGFTERTKIIIGIAVGGGFLFIFVVLTICMVRRKRNKPDTVDMVGDSLTLLKNINASFDQHGELINFDFGAIALATKKFSSENKIGAGGFGDVYKGILGDGQIVAVKRISFQSEERINEFVMEVKLIAKLQHRNLVRLLGYCIKGSERLLIYEFVPNKSLDFFIFGDEEKRQWLDWEKRLSIIMGVARGLLYLHQDSRLRVIHRDLKAANILLDENMNPKISDFGTARIFEHEQIEDNTIKIVGTRGYMSPEYIMNGNFSEKSDVFSFGVLALEITSGRRNKWLSQEDNCMELLANAWRLCMENEIHNLLDTTLNRPTQIEKLIRVIKVGLLCVQESPNDRPTMQEVVIMLVKEHIALPQPKRPGFFQYISVSSAFDCFPLAIDPRTSECQLTNTTLDGR